MPHNNSRISKTSRLSTVKLTKSFERKIYSRNAIEKKREGKYGSNTHKNFLDNSGINKRNELKILQKAENDFDLIVQAQKKKLRVNKLIQELKSDKILISDFNNTMNIIDSEYQELLTIAQKKIELDEIVKESDRNLSFELEESKEDKSLIEASKQEEFKIRERKKAERLQILRGGRIDNVSDWSKYSMNKRIDRCADILKLQSRRSKNLIERIHLTQDRAKLLKDDIVSMNYPDIPEVNKAIYGGANKVLPNVYFIRGNVDKCETCSNQYQHDRPAYLDNMPYRMRDFNQKFIGLELPKKQQRPATTSSLYRRPQKLINEPESIFTITKELSKKFVDNKLESRPHCRFGNTLVTSSGVLRRKDMDGYCEYNPLVDM